ncbi:hypothetical protein Patl1_14068 [Pistacia atlantica]|uniref:Uncharacterized protein n=1 Tax=Pistacia atlantica TaxID=434234 RepID=A0ACC1AXV8_9ROSI|nr:hypothetical protein Patl1_14068 [Pistacia atlantica]
MCIIFSSFYNSSTSSPILGCSETRFCNFNDPVWALGRSDWSLLFH